MKKVKLFVALCAIALCFSSVKAKPADGGFKNWFSYIGGNPYDPANYRLVSFDPGCAAFEELCAVYVQIDWSTFRPNVAALYLLGLQSTNFTHPGNYLGGVVEMTFAQ